MSTTPKLTPYERARLIGRRAQQLAMGAPSSIPMNTTDPLEHAMSELRAGVIPLLIVRHLPDGTQHICDPNQIIT